MKKFQQIDDLIIYPNTKSTIEVVPTDGYNGAHRYRVQLSTGFNSKKNTYDYVDKTTTIQFVQKNDDGSIIPGLQSEQLALILLDRVKKLNERYPSPYNDIQIEGLTMYLQACSDRVEERINRGVMGKLEK
ncbi:hypothetical protein [Intestinibacter sp.]|uniref:hypothetical protein n=1 Tax=Intestinibacter sp. TaxID=1965304 RepID=UPI003F171172